MKLTLRSCATALILLMPISLMQLSESHAAASTSFSTLAKITVQAINDSHVSDVGEVCATVDGSGSHTSSTSKSLPPMDYSGNQGDRWIYMEPFEIEMFQYRYFYWDGVIWLDGSGVDENGDESEANSEELWNNYNSDFSALVEAAKKSQKGYKCKFLELSRIEIVGQDPSPSYKGQIGDVHIKIDSKFSDAELGYLWNGSKWIANLENTYTLAHAAATRTKSGEYCIYGKNKDVYSSYYSAPPVDYKGVKADLWIVADKTSGSEVGRFFWSGKAWVENNANGFEQLKAINEAAQLKARSTSIGEVCYAGTNTSAQTFSSNLPKSYKGKVNDRWIVMDKKGEKSNIYYYWTGKSWILN